MRCDLRDKAAMGPESSKRGAPVGAFFGLLGRWFPVGPNISVVPLIASVKLAREQFCPDPVAFPNHRFLNGCAIQVGCFARTGVEDREYLAKAADPALLSEDILESNAKLPTGGRPTKVTPLGKSRASPEPFWLNTPKLTPP
jgi:hypothetical protein